MLSSKTRDYDEDILNILGINNLGELNAAIKDFTGKQSYANRILNYIIVIPTSGGIEP